MSNGEGVLLPEPALWVAGLECRTGGWIDALAWAAGEFTQPMFTASQLRAYGEQCRALGWRPIESAPRDGTYFLAIDKDGAYRIAVMFDLWGEWKCCAHAIVFPATHWMPLPATPTPGGTP